MKVWIAMERGCGGGDESVHGVFSSRRCERDQEEKVGDTTVYVHAGAHCCWGVTGVFMTEKEAAKHCDSMNAPEEWEVDSGDCK